MNAQHGTVTRYRSACRCTPCRGANARYSKQRRLRMLEGRNLTVDPTGTRRRIEALQRMSWSLQDIADEAGWASEQATHRLLQRKRLKPETAAKVAELYERLCMTVGPSPRAAIVATRRGYAPPLAWDDIDHDEDPQGVGVDRTGDDDTVKLDRLLAGERLPATRAERLEVLARWLATGRSMNELERIHGWNLTRDKRLARANDNDGKAA